MADERIDIRVRLRDADKARREIENVADAIDDIGDAQRRAAVSAGLWQDKQGKWRNRLGQFATDAEKAASGIETLTGSMDSATRQTNSVSKQFSVLSGRAGAMTGVVVAATPILIAAGGALVAVAGSAAAAAAGIGALGIGALGVAGVGLGGFAILATKAATTISEALKKLQEGFFELTKPAYQRVVTFLSAAAAAAQRLMPAFAAATNAAAAVLGPALGAALLILSGPEMQQAITLMGQVFAQLAGPIVQAGTLAFQAFARTAVAAAPLLTLVSGALLDIATQLAAFTASSGFVGVIRDLVGHTRAWWELTVAVGRAVGTILIAGASFGKGLVQDLTGIVDKWATWLNTTEGQKALVRFFQDAVAQVKVLAPILGKFLVAVFELGRVAIPAATAAFQVLKPIVEKVSEVLAFATLTFGRMVELSSRFWGAFSGAASDVAGVVSNVFGAIVSTISGALQFLIDQVNHVIGAINALPHIGTPLGDIGIPHIAPIGPIGAAPSVAPGGANPAVAGPPTPGARRSAGRGGRSAAGPSVAAFAGAGVGTAGLLGGIPPIQISLQVDKREIARANVRANRRTAARRAGPLAGP